jgi:aromatase
MPRICHEIDVRRPPADVFDITNDIDSWHLLFNEYRQSTVIKREEAGRFTKLLFELGNEDGARWRSWRLLDHEDLIAVAERLDPLFPFAFMHLKWTYHAVPGGTRMVWAQDFELDPEAGVSNADAVAKMNAHGMDNQRRIKEIIEAGFPRPAA